MREADAAETAEAAALRSASHGRYNTAMDKWLNYQGNRPPRIQYDYETEKRLKTDRMLRADDTRRWLIAVGVTLLGFAIAAVCFVVFCLATDEMPKSRRPSGGIEFRR
jgi:hypothetical protein